MSIKDILSLLLFRLNVTSLARWARSERLIVFGYHRIRDPNDPYQHEFDPDVVGPDQVQLKEQLSWVARYFDLISEDDLLELIVRGPGGKKPSALITFDDGYRDNFTLAAPVLSELGIPAIFFVPTEIINFQKLGWWDLITYLVNRTHIPELSTSGMSFRFPADRQQAILFLQHSMKVRHANETKDLISELSSNCGVPLPQPNVQASQLMTWEQIGQASLMGIAIGSHTHTHRVLTTLNRRDIEEEMSQSKQIIESRVSQTIKSIAYPCGSYGYFNSDSETVAQEVGYRFGFSFNTGVNAISSVEPYNVRRQAAPARLARLASMAAFPTTFSYPRTK